MPWRLIMTNFEKEILEQPQVLEKVINDENLDKVAQELAKKDVQIILTLARGSSDNAVTFFSYLAGQYLGIPVASLPPSLFSVYSSKMKIKNALVIGVSQSGESSDVVAGLQSIENTGAISLAISNKENSSLAKVADYSINQQAGQELAVAASKTFSSQMMVLASLVAKWSKNQELKNALAKVPTAMNSFMNNSQVKDTALRLTHAESAYILGRGLSYAPALELALKLKETNYLHAQAYSSAEFQHGPIAAVSATDPIILLANSDQTIASNQIVAQKLHNLGADITIVSANQSLFKYANSLIQLPDNLHTVSESFLQILASQLLALNLTISKGLDPDAPRNLSKVTKTL